MPEPSQIKDIATNQAPRQAVNAVFSILRSLLPSSAEKRLIGNLANGNASDLPLLTVEDNAGEGAQAGIVPPAPSYVNDNTICVLCNVGATDEDQTNRPIWIPLISSTAGIYIERADNEVSQLSIGLAIGNTADQIASGDRKPGISTYTSHATPGSSIDVVQVNSPNPVTITLNPNFSNKWGYIVVKNLGMGTVSFAGGNMFNGTSTTIEQTYSISTQRGFLCFYLDGTIWRVFSKG